ncbi:MAG TPA: DNA-binding domain-containing protein [Opitutaceae bacterium]|nr:DNA-binding domain-containing protein [Opitutaceae bacterium]
MKSRRQSMPAAQRPSAGAKPARSAGARAAGPVGMPGPPAHAPRRLRSVADLRQLQRLMTHALVRPLEGADDAIARHWPDGRTSAEVAAEFIKPNDRLTSLERLEIYARGYWYRLIECVYDDCPGLRAALGDRRFSALSRAYLAKYPSRSFNLSELCERLPQFIAEEPHWTAPHTEFARAIARFERAQTVAFEAASLPPVTADDLAASAPHRLRLTLQPHVSLLALDWPIDDFVIAVKERDALRREASNAVGESAPRAARRRVARPRRQPVHLVVHRFQNRLFYKRLTPPAFAVLEALAAGRTVAQAVSAAGRAVRAEDVRDWFTTWSRLGWLCRRTGATRFPHRRPAA